MTAATHKRFSIGFAYIALMALYAAGFSQIYYYLALPIILSASTYGAKMPDVDHHWSSVKDKTISNKILNTLIHITGGKHRSWQTHSWDIIILATVAAIFLPELLHRLGNISALNKEVASLLFIGVSCGWVSHGIADMMTSGGMRITCLSKQKIAFVPKEFKFSYAIWAAVILVGIAFIAFFKVHRLSVIPVGVLAIAVLVVGAKLKGFRFNTGDDWESFIFKCTAVTNFCLGTACLIYPLINKDIIGIDILELLNKTIFK